MFECVVWLSQMLYDRSLRVLSSYLRCYMLNVCVCCLVISDVICQMFGGGGGGGLVIPVVIW